MRTLALLILAIILGTTSTAFAGYTAFSSVQYQHHEEGVICAVARMGQAQRKLINKVSQGERWGKMDNCTVYNITIAHDPTDEIGILDRSTYHCVKKPNLITWIAMDASSALEKGLIEDWEVSAIDSTPSIVCVKITEAAY